MKNYFLLIVALLILAGMSCGIKQRPTGTPCVYVLSNKAYSGLYKVGFTTRPPAERAAELYSTGVPFPFEIEYVLYSSDARRIESDAHRALDEYSVNPKREFFMADTIMIINTINKLK